MFFNSLIRLMFFSIVAMLLTSCSSAKLTNQGYSRLNGGNLSKAESKFQKAITKANRNPSLLHRPYHGLAIVSERNGNFQMASDYAFKAYQADKLNPAYAYGLARYNAHGGNTQSAYNWLFYIGDIESQNRGSLRTYGDKAPSDPLFSTIAGDMKFRRWCAGYRRLKISPDRGYSSESDKFTQNDQFVTITGQLPNGERKVILCSSVIEDNNAASWYNDYVVFDYKLGTSIKVTQLDEDYTSHDVLSSYSGHIPFDLGIKEIKGRQSRLELSIQDTEDTPYTTGTSIPSTINPEIIGIALAGAIVYGAGELIYSGIKNSAASSSSGSYSATSNSNEGFKVVSSKECSKVEVSASSVTNSTVNLDFDLLEVCTKHNMVVTIRDRADKKVTLSSPDELRSFYWNNTKNRFDPPVSVAISYYGGCELSCPWDHCRKLREANVQLTKTGYWKIKVDP